MPNTFDTVRYSEADILFATQSASKVEANKATIQELAALREDQTPISVDSIDPEIFKPESDLQTADEVAWEKTETLRENVLFSPEKRTLILAFDVVTLIAETPYDFDAGNAEDLKKLLRQVDFNEDVETERLWECIMETLDTEEVRMLQRCTKGAFTIEWHIGFALNSSDRTVANRGAVVLRATFTALDPTVVFQAFALSENLEEMREQGKRPTPKDLTNGVKAFAIGPRLPFVKLIPEYADTTNLIAYNRDNPDEKFILTPEQFFSLVRDCALTPQMALQLLADSETLEPNAHPLEKETVKFSF